MKTLNVILISLILVFAAIGVDQLLQEKEQTITKLKAELADAKDSKPREIQCVTPPPKACLKEVEKITTKEVTTSCSPQYIHIVTSIQNSAISESNTEVTARVTTSAEKKPKLQLMVLGGVTTQSNLEVSGMKAHLRDEYRPVFGGAVGIPVGDYSLWGVIQTNGTTLIGVSRGF